MMRSFFLLVFVIALPVGIQAQKALPVKKWGTGATNAFIFYLSGDGGLNSFSTDLCNQVSAAGHSVSALNSRSYFWNKKTPQQAADDISAQLKKDISKSRNPGVVMVGYSFGADVLPFIINRLPSSVKTKVSAVVLISPAMSTDFEIHLTDMLGQGKKRSMDVVAEINRMVVRKTVIVQNNDDKDFPVKKINAKNISVETLSGGHHFDGNIKLLVQTILKYCN